MGCNGDEWVGEEDLEGDAIVVDGLSGLAVEALIALVEGAEEAATEEEGVPFEGLEEGWVETRVASKGSQCSEG